MADSQQQQQRRRRLEQELIQQWLIEQNEGNDTKHSDYDIHTVIGYTEGRMCQLLGIDRLTFRTVCQRIQETEPIKTLGLKFFYSLKSLQELPGLMQGFCNVLNESPLYTHSEPMTEELALILLQQLMIYELRDLVDEMLQEEKEK